MSTWWVHSLFNAACRRRSFAKDIVQFMSRMFYSQEGRIWAKIWMNKYQCSMVESKIGKWMWTGFSLWLHCLIFWLFWTPRSCILTLFPWVVQMCAKYWLLWNPSQSCCVNFKLFTFLRAVSRPSKGNKHVSVKVIRIGNWAEKQRPGGWEKNRNSRMLLWDQLLNFIITHLKLKHQTASWTNSPKSLKVPCIDEQTQQPRFDERYSPRLLLRGLPNTGQVWKTPALGVGCCFVGMPLSLFLTWWSCTTSAYFTNQSRCCFMLYLDFVLEEADVLLPPQEWNCKNRDTQLRNTSYDRSHLKVGLNTNDLMNVSGTFFSLSNSVTD